MQKKRLILMFVLIDLTCASLAYSDDSNLSVAKANIYFTENQAMQAAAPCTLTQTNGNGVASLPFMEALIGAY